jgi:hypothetical protein
MTSPPRDAVDALGIDADEILTAARDEQSKSS